MHRATRSISANTYLLKTTSKSAARLFFPRIKSLKCKQILIYIHGFSNLPDDVFAAAKEFQDLCDHRKPGEIAIIPFIWPCDDDKSIVDDYFDDQDSADMSFKSGARVFDFFNTWRSDKEQNPADDPCLKRLNVLAHSMGTRVFRGSVRNWSLSSLSNTPPLLFRNTFLVASDVVNETLEYGHSGETICHASRNVVVYSASDDLALRASKVANLKSRIASRRLGHTGPENMDKVPKNVFHVDCDDVNTSYDYPKGHSYFRSGKKKGQPGVVFDHIFECILKGRVFPDDERRRSSILKETTA